MIAPMVMSLAPTPRSGAAPPFPTTESGGTTPSLLAWVPGFTPPGAENPPASRPCSDVPELPSTLAVVVVGVFFTEQAVDADANVKAAQPSASVPVSRRCPNHPIVDPPWSLRLRE